MAFTLPTFVANPTLATGNLRLAAFVADPTLATGNLRLATFVADPTLTVTGAKLPVFVSDPTITVASAKLPIFVSNPTEGPKGVILPTFIAAGLPLSATGIAGYFEPFAVSLDGVVGSDSIAVLIMQPFTLSMDGVQQLPLVMQNFIVSMTGQSGTVASVDVRLEQFTVSMTSDPFGEMILQLQGFSAALTGVAGGIGVQAGTTEYFTSAMTGYVQVTGAIDVGLRNFSISMSGDIGISTNYVTIAMHTEWQALTQYTNYPFNSFAVFNNQFMGASGAGLFVLTGASDNGVNIDSSMRTGITDMGTSHLKKVEFIYVGYRATGDLKLRVNTNDSHVRDYLIKHNGETGLHVKSVKLGKGVVARYWQLEMQNINGADFNLNTLEIKPNVLSRRVSGGRA